MGVLLEIILQFFLEFLLQIVGEVIVEAIFQKLSHLTWVRKTLNALLAVMMYLGLGIIAGWLSILIFPNSFIRSSTLHGISLLITPSLAGLTMAGIGWIRRQEGKLVIPLESFAYGFVFAFGMALIRLLFTQ
jgi:hypothetical protein